MATASTAPMTNLWSKKNILAYAPDEASIPAAQKVLKKGGFGTVEATADGKGWWVVCQGITDIYQVSARIEDGGFACDCTCPSPKYPCKHALALLLYLGEHPEERAEPEEPKYAPTDFEALIRAVFRDPEDDTPRLVLADYLEENGESDRAALIRLQCEHERTPARSPRARELEKEIRPLVARLRAMVVEPLPEGVVAEFHRGFVHLNTDLYAFREIGSLPARFTALFQNGWVEVVRIVGYFFDAVREDHATLFSLVGELDFSQHPLTTDTLVSVAAQYADMRANGRLERVRVAKRNRKTFEAFLAAREGHTIADSGEEREAQQLHRGLTPQSLDLLIRAGRLRGARRLALDGPINDRGAELLAAADLAHLESLRLGRSCMSEEGIFRLANATNLSGLRELGYVSSGLCESHFTVLELGSALSGLRALDLENTELTDATALALARVTKLSHLSRLSVASNQITATGLSAILRSPNLPELALIDVSNNRRLQPAALLALVLEAAPRPELSLLASGLEVRRSCDSSGIRVSVEYHEGRLREYFFTDLEHCAAARRVTSFRAARVGLGPSGITMLALRFSPDALQELELHDLPFHNDGAEALAQSFAQYRLHTLRLPTCRIQASGVAALAASPLAASLRVLDLSGNMIGKGGAEALVKSPHLAHLERLILSGPRIGKAEQKTLATRFGKVLEI